MRIQCKNCGRGANLWMRGLCIPCYHIPGVKEKFPHITTGNGGSAQSVPEEEKPALRPRREGEMPERCFWCRDWACREVMKLCPKCQAWLDKAKLTMPTEFAY